MTTFTDDLLPVADCIFLPRGLPVVLSADLEDKVIINKLRGICQSMKFKMIQIKD